jgi:hypothetical protein
LSNLLETLGQLKLTRIVAIRLSFAAHGDDKPFFGDPREGTLSWLTLSVAILVL